MSNAPSNTAEKSETAPNPPAQNLSATMNDLAHTRSCNAFLAIDTNFRLKNRHHGESVERGWPMVGSSASTDGEAPERAWATLAPMSTHPEMGPGTRRDILDDQGETRFKHDVEIKDGEIKDA
ncbi:hypothetical protein C8R44DRAFT_881767 [Mycena epipterygia]|nr:hypothetical protein C8R44DRAFT_881767 [Mycena epipterygia]